MISRMIRKKWNKFNLYSSELFWNHWRSLDTYAALLWWRCRSLNTRFADRFHTGIPVNRSEPEKCYYFFDLSTEKCNNEDLKNPKFQQFFIQINLIEFLSKIFT